MTPKQLKAFWKRLSGSGVIPDIEIAELERLLDKETKVPQEVVSGIKGLYEGRRSGCPDVSLGSIWDVIVDYVASQQGEDLPEEARYILAFLKLESPQSRLVLSSCWALRADIWSFGQREKDADAAMDLLVSEGLVREYSKETRLAGAVHLLALVRSPGEKSLKGIRQPMNGETNEKLPCSGG